MTQETINGREITPDQDFVIDSFQPADAQGVADLFLEIYGHEYPIKKFIKPELLIEENESGRTVSSVARTEKGEIVGHNAVYNSAYWSGNFESGSGVVHRHYRGPDKKIFVKLVEHGQKYLVDSKRGHGIFGEPLCSHIISQRLTYERGWITHALEVDLIPGTTYVKEKKLAGRVSTLMDFQTLIPRPHTIYVPSIYRNQLEFLYNELDDEREFIHQEDNWPNGVLTEIDPLVFEAASTARLAVLKAGSDFGEYMDREEKKLRKLGITTIQIWLNLTWPWVGKAVEELRDRGFFFGGLLPRWLDDDALLMHKITPEPNWDGINMLYDRAKRLLEMVRKDWTEVA